MNDLIKLPKKFSAQFFKKIQPFLFPHFPLPSSMYFSTENKMPCSHTVEATSVLSREWPLSLKLTNKAQKSIFFQSGFLTSILTFHTG